MSMPKIPDINANININRDDAINIIVASIALEELSLAHILNAEGEKLQYVLGTLEGRDPGEVTICDIMEVNNSIQKTLRDVIKAEMLLQFKLEDVLELDENENACQLTITGNKIWRDSDNIDGIRPSTVDISLLRDGEVYKTVTINTDGDGAYTFPCLPVWRDSVNKYTYQIDETVVPDGYTKTINGFNIINTINTILAGSITINGTKVWADNANETQERPTEITVILLQNGVQYRSLLVTSPADEEDTALFSFTDVPRFDDQGNPFVYTLYEEDLESYDKSIDGFNITNTLQTP